MILSSEFFLPLRFVIQREGAPHQIGGIKTRILVSTAYYMKWQVGKLSTEYRK